MNDAHHHNDGLLADRFANSTQKTEPPTAQERRAFNNVMGVHKPVPFDQAECDAKISRVVKDSAERNAAQRKERETAQGISTPQAIENRLKLEHYRLKQDANNAAIRLNSYGTPDVRHAEVKIAAILKTRKDAQVAGSLGEERRQEKLLVAAEEELVQAQAKLVRFRTENTRAVGLLKSWEKENLPSEKAT